MIIKSSVKRMCIQLKSCRAELCVEKTEYFYDVLDDISEEIQGSIVIACFENTISW